MTTLMATRRGPDIGEICSSPIRHPGPAPRKAYGQAGRFAGWLALMPLILMPLTLMPLTLAPRPAAALTVFDPANFEQNLLQAARALTQITNQLQSLQNEMAMLHNMARNLTPLDYSALHALAAALRQMNDLMRRARGIGFDLAATEAAWARHYPRHYEENTRHAALLEDARQRWSHAVDGLHQAMLVQAETVGNLAGDSQQLAALLARSDAAVGNLQVGQAGNQLLALLTKQQLQAQSLAAAQYRAQALQEARAALAQEQARLQLQQFLGSRHAYDGRR